MFVAAYPRETQEMVFDAHNRAFAFFGGVPLRMVYDNFKVVVQTSARCLRSGSRPSAVVAVRMAISKMYNITTRLVLHQKRGASLGESIQCALLRTLDQCVHHVAGLGQHLATGRPQGTDRYFAAGVAL